MRAGLRFLGMLALAALALQLFFLLRIAMMVVVGTFVTVQCLFATGADAALTDVAIDPTSGATGTSVTVSGSACAPGLLINPSHAGVVVATFGVSIDVVVPPNGIWSAHRPVSTP